jgi:hypothetical protein
MPLALAGGAGSERSASQVVLANDDISGRGSRACSIDAPIHRLIAG